MRAMNSVRVNPLRLAIGAYGLMLLTTVHHVYGAIQFETPWRFHVAHVAGLTMLLLTISLLIARWRPPARSAMLWTFLVISVLVPILWIGFFEGGYNHALKLLLYGTGVSESLLLSLFPPPVYEAPSDAWFEVTGLLQFLLATWAGREAWRLERSLRTAA